MSILKLIYYLTRVWLIRQPEIWSARRKGYLVLIDRDLADVGIDPVRYRVSAPTWVLSLFQRFAPQPDLTLVLNAPPDAVLKRSKELDINTLTSLSAKYKSYAQRAHNAILLDANHPASDVASRASTAILGGKTYAPPQKTN